MLPERAELYLYSCSTEVQAQPSHKTLSHISMIMLYILSANKNATNTNLFYFVKCNTL